MVCGFGCDVIALGVVLKLEGWWGMMLVCLITFQTKSRPLETKLELHFTDRPLGPMRCRSQVIVRSLL